MKKNVLLFTAILISTLCFCQSSFARLVQILHTNDTHSFLNNSIHDPERGGAERLKTLIDSYKEKMAAEGVKTIVLDGGDFMEGNLYYMADNARKTFNVHNEMGYDVGVLGNHDYLMGTNELDKLLGETSLKFGLVAANLEFSPAHKNLAAKIKPYEELNIDGMKIAVLGLTTNEIFYKWRFEKGLVTNPFESAKNYEKILKDRGNDFIIALTHIGLFNDMRLLARTKSIDLVVGGHSHDALYTPKYAKNRAGNMIAVVQAGAHTEYLGRVLVDLEKGKPLKIVKYELLPVRIAANDSVIKNMVDEADNDLNALYGTEWLNERVGFSELKVGDEAGMKKWAVYVAEAIREKSDADIAIHAPPMNGNNFPVGAMNRRDLFNSFPRILDINDKYGWNIYTTTIRGVWLRITLEALSLFGQPLIFAGVDIDYIPTPLGLKIRRMRINGKQINPFKNYKVAVTEGIVKGAQGVDDRTVAILRHPVDTKFKIWQTLEEQLRKRNVHFKLTTEHTFYKP